MMLDEKTSGVDPFRVLATAYACEPGLGSEPGIGWNWARQIAMRHELTLVTRQNNVAAIRDAAEREGLTIDVVGHDLPPALMKLKRGGRGAMAYTYAWQRSLRGVCADLAAEREFDVTHHLTFASGWIPSGLARLGLPFVFGPVGEHPPIPSAYLSRALRRERFADRFRNGAKQVVPMLDGAVEETWEAADVLLSLGRTFEERLPERFDHKVVRMLAAGVDAEIVTPPKRRDEGAPLRILFAGRLVELKGVRLALAAAAHLDPDTDATLEIVGDGPLRRTLEVEAEHVGIPVTFHGALDHASTLERMRECDVFLFPSFEGAGMVVPEAMASGAAVVALDQGGPGEMVAEGRGVAARMRDDFDTTAYALASTLDWLASHEVERLEIAERGHDWAVRETTWDAKGEALAEIYRDAIAHFAQRKVAA